MKRKTVLSMAWENMKQRKLRTTLTTLGVLIGITAILAVTSLGEGFRTMVTEQIEYFELDVVMVMPSMLDPQAKPYLTHEDAQNISQIDKVTVATPVMQTMTVLYNEGKNVTTFLLAVNFTEFGMIYPERLDLEEGRLPQPNENDTIVLGYGAAHRRSDETFAKAGDNVTMMVKGLLGWEPYNVTIAGVLKESGEGMLISLDDAVFMPLNVAETMLKIDHIAPINMIFVKVADSDYSEDVAEEIEDMFEDKVMTFVPGVMVQRAGNILDMVELFLAGIAGIALLVAGVGIMNIMTVSVMERTREIGILKAIGAKNRNILSMFLAEAALIGLTGGLLGIPAGYGLAHFLSYALSTIRPQSSNGLFQGGGMALNITPVLSLSWVVGALVFGIVVSLLFALYPARKAAKLDPVEALRYE
jgi:putative ABC transport system permease protein